MAPAIGGVLLRGQKGAAKTTLARGLARLLPGEAPFAELPLGATEDRVVGTLDLAAALRGAERRFEPGVLAAAHGGVLYVDEVNLLADHLVDVLLDVATSGVNRVEREGISHEHPARFVLVGSMNPEEGELRPQLLDRFGLAVDVASSLDPDERALAVERRLAFDADPTGFLADCRDAEARLRAELATARPATVPRALLRDISALCAAMAVDGLRADLVIARAAAARAGLAGRPEADADDVRAVAPLALGHRQRRTPFDQPGGAEAQLEEAFDDVFGEAEEADADRDDAGGQAPERTAAAGRAGGAADPGRHRPPAGRRPPLTGARRPRVAWSPPARSSRATRWRWPPPLGPPGNGGPPPATSRPSPTSGGRCASRRRATSWCWPSTRRARWAPSSAWRRPKGRCSACCSTPTSAGTGSPSSASGARRPRSSCARRVPSRWRGPASAACRPAAGPRWPPASTPPPRSPPPPARPPPTARCSCVVTDGRATAGPPGVDPIDAAMAAAERVRRRGIDAVVVDAEVGGPGAGPRLGLAARLATALGARYLPLSAFTADTLRSTS